MLCVLIFYVLKEVLEKQKIHSAFLVISSFLSLIIITALFETDSDIAFHLLANGFHTSSFLMSILSLLLVIKIRRGSKKKMTWLALIIFIGALNDKLFYVLFVAPMLLTNLLLFVTNRHKYDLKTAIVITVSAAVAFLCFNLLKNSTNYSFIVQHYSPHLIDIQHSTNVFINYWKGVYASFTLWSLLFSIEFVLFISLVIFFFKRKLNTFNVFSLLFCLLVLFTPIVLGMLNRPSKMRYSMFVFYILPVSGVVAFISSINFAKTKIFSWSIILLTLIILGLKTTTLKKEKIATRIISYQPQRVKNLEKLHAQNPSLKNGISSYWVAKQTTYFSKTGLRIYAIYYPNIEPNFYTAHNKWWYYSKDENTNQKFNFIVLENPKDSLLFQKQFHKRTLGIFHEGNTYIIKTKPFTYKNINGRACYSTL